MSGIENNLWTSYGWPLTVIVGQILALALPLVLFVAYAVYADRKIWAAVQLRRGPNVVGIFGLLQPFADAFKNFFKEVIVPDGADKVVFFLAPLMTFALAFIGWAVIPVNDH